jgi:hypothetical protein
MHTSNHKAKFDLGRAQTDPTSKTLVWYVFSGMEILFIAKFMCVEQSNVMASNLEFSVLYIRRSWSRDRSVKVTADFHLGLSCKFLGSGFVVVDLYHLYMQV